MVVVVVLHYPFKIRLTITAVKMERCETAGVNRDFNHLYLINQMGVLLQGQSWLW